MILSLLPSREIGGSFSFQIHASILNERIASNFRKMFNLTLFEVEICDEIHFSKILLVLVHGAIEKGKLWNALSSPLILIAEITV